MGVKTPNTTKQNPRQRKTGFHTTQYQKSKRNTLNAQTGGKLSPWPIVIGPSSIVQASSPSVISRVFTDVVTFEQESLTGGRAGFNH